MFNLFSKFSEEEIKPIDQQLQNLFTEKQIKEIIQLANEKHCVDVDVSIFFYEDDHDHNSVLTSDLKYVLFSEDYETIDYVPKSDDTEITLIVISGLKLNSQLFKSRKSWVKKLSFIPYFEEQVKSITRLDDIYFFYNHNDELDDDEKRAFDLPNNQLKFSYIHFIFNLKE